MRDGLPTMQLKLALLCLELIDGFEEDVAGYAQGFGGDFVESVLGGVPIAGGGVEADDVDGGDVAL